MNKLMATTTFAESTYPRGRDGKSSSRSAPRSRGNFWGSAAAAAADLLIAAAAIAVLASGAILFR